MWLLERFLGASGDFFTGVWGLVYDLHGGNEIILWTLTPWFVSNVVFVLANVFFTFVDLTASPKFMLKYKIQEDKNVPVSWKLYKKALRRVIFNITVVSFGLTLVTYPVVRWRGSSCGRDLPLFSTTILHMLGFLVLVEIGFYYSHRLCHHRLLYKYIHKTHHEWTAPVGITAVYCHPLEHLVVNLMPVVIGPLVMGSHLSVTMLWHTIAILNTTVSHCGYHLPFLPSSEGHDYHHLKFNQNYGTLGFLDRLHGTDQGFRDSKSYERHYMIFGFSPARQLFPDKSTKGKTE